MNTVALWGEEILSQERYSSLLGDLCDPTQNDGFSYFYRNEYLIFQKIIKLEYDFPEKFFPKARDLVEKLLVNILHFLLVR